MATQLEVVNRVLRRLREDTVQGITDDPEAQLVAEFVADAHAEVQDAWDWRSLVHRVHIDVSSGTSKYDLSAKVASGGDVRDSDVRVPKPESELQYVLDMPQVWVYDNDSTDEVQVPTMLGPEAFNEIKARDRDGTEADASYFTLYREADSSGGRKLYLELFPQPTASRVVEMELWTPQDDLQTDGTTDTTDLLVPDRPVYLIALYFASQERGEELGGVKNSQMARRAIDALGAAIERDANTDIRSGRFDWYRG